MKKSRKVILSVVLILLLIQFYRPNEVYNEVPVKHLSGVPDEVTAILNNSCFDCHSSYTKLQWFDQLTPANFLVTSHIENGRKALNFSKWDSLPPPKQKATLFYALNNVLSHNMPLAGYTVFHPSTKVDDGEIKVLKEYVKSLSSREQNNTTPATISNNDYLNNTIKLNVKPSPNGLEYIPDYKNWKAISTTDRFDNGTMRIIYGNDVAVNAISDTNTDQWPDGTIFAKAAWKQETLSDGSIVNGEFIQVEFMVKDSKKYSKTYGWGWGRWKGMELKPYGEGVNFDTECMQCHSPMKKRDYVFTSPLFLTSK
ncbi:cytochrome P460 family protein [Flavobacterium rakeshii]|uniref:cytochrome P460 family protein n=1 Tax=Flavobacterium rakeshii TaxID=1038845 RepID=UPI002E7B53D5|nr:cytochrome P460 family protein [Flavobacterium rakeshii]MEE1898624.1 cytochrome P460 family protein [Flavobacterium rakeshii]